MFAAIVSAQGCNSSITGPGDGQLAGQNKDTAFIQQNVESRCQKLTVMHSTAFTFFMHADRVGPWPAYPIQLPRTEALLCSLYLTGSLSARPLVHQAGKKQLR